MSLRHKRRAWHGVVGGLGVVAALGGFVGHYYSVSTTIVLAFSIFILGAVVVNLLTDPPDKG